MLLKRTNLLSFLLAALIVPPAGAAERDQPIQIEADSVRLDDAKRESVYRGNVRLQQGSLSMSAHSLTISAPHDDRQLLVLEGDPATFRTVEESSGKEVRGKALRIEYDSKLEVMHLAGTARLWHGKNKFQSANIVYDASRNHIEAGDPAGNGERVKIVIEPESE